MVDKSKHEEMIATAIEHLEKAKDELYSIGVECSTSIGDDESTYCDDTETAMDEFIEHVQETIDELSDYKENEYKDAGFICDHSDTCTQRLVVCEHQKPHCVKRLNTKLSCDTQGCCSVSETECKCIKK